MVSGSVQVEGTTTPVGASGRTSLRNRAFVLVLCAQAASGIVGGAAPMALPAIRSYFDTSSAAIQWYAALYSLGFALVLILAGRIGDLFGTRRLLLIGYATFIVSIIGSALAPTIGVLLAFRLLQGIGAGVMAPQLSAMVQRTFRGHDRTRAFGVFLMVAGGTFMVGQLVSGALITADVWGLSWRWVYLPSIPFALVTLVVAFKALPPTPPGAPGRLDIAGAVVLAVASFLLMFPIIQGRGAGWPTWIILMLVAAVPAYGAFLAYERRLLTLGRDPLVDPTLFRIRSFGVGNLITVFVALLGYAAPIYLILTIQSGFHRTAFEAALITAPMPFLNMFGSLASAPLVRRFGRGALVIGGLLVALAAALVLLATRGDPATVKAVQLIPGIGLTGFAVGVVMAAATSIVLHEVPPRFAGSAAGVQSTSLQLAGSVGIAFFGMVFYGTIGESTDLAAYLDAIDNVQWLVLALAIVQVAMVFLMPRHRVGKAEEITPVDPEMAVLPDFHGTDA
jgi:MFS family permease